MRGGGGLSVGGLRCGSDAGRHRKGALHRPLRRAHDVHRRARASGLRSVRPLVIAHRGHGRLALSNRGDGPGGDADAHVRGDHRLWHDRDEPGQLPERRGRSAGASGLDHWPGAAAPGGQGRRRGGQDCRARDSRGALHARVRGDARLLGGCGAERRSDRRRGLDAHRRRRRHRRAGLRQYRRTDQGHGHPRGREHLSA